MRLALNGLLDGLLSKGRLLMPNPGLDLNFDIPSDEEAEESFFIDCSGEPNTPAEVRSPSSPSAPTSALDA